MSNWRSLPNTIRFLPYLLVALVLGTSSLVKALYPSRTIDLLVLFWHQRPQIAYAELSLLAGLEWILACWLLSGAWSKLAQVSACAFLLGISISPLAQLIRHSALPCGCGTPPILADAAGSPAKALLRNGLLLCACAAASAGNWIDSRRPPILPLQIRST